MIDTYSKMLTRAQRRRAITRKTARDRLHALIGLRRGNYLRVLLTIMGVAFLLCRAVGHSSPASTIRVMAQWQWSHNQMHDLT